MKRYHITLGARTSSGGTVIAASSMISIDGIKVALEGDQITCPACKSSGVILCTWPRLPQTFNGKQVALENDYCICKCSPPPRLIPTQARSFQQVDGQVQTTQANAASGSSAGSAASMATPGTVAAGASAGAQDVGNSADTDKPYDEQAKLDAKGEAALAGLPYYIETSDGRMFSGNADEDGKLPRVFTDSEDEFTVYWGDEALAKAGVQE